MSIPKIMFFFATVLSIVLYWAASSVCRYNFALEKKTEILNISEEDIASHKLMVKSIKEALWNKYNY